MKTRTGICLAMLLVAPALADMEGTGKGMEEQVGSPKDWSIYAITVKQYFMFRNLVRDAYVEVQTWKALKATWEEQKRWFERNKQRWNRIKTTMGSLSSDPEDILTNLEKIEDVTKDIDEFVMVETKRMDNILMTYEDNVSVAWDVAGPYLGNRYVPADQIWKQFNKFCQDHTMRNNPDWKKAVEISGEDPGYAAPIYNLAEWKRRNLLGKSYSYITSQGSALKMRQQERQKYWNRFQSEATAALATNENGDPKPDAVQGIDVMRRVQTLADMGDLILTRQVEAQAAMAVVGDDVYQLTNEVQNSIRPINETKYLAKFMEEQAKAATP